MFTTLLCNSTLSISLNSKLEEMITMIILIVFSSTTYVIPARISTRLGDIEGRSYMTNKGKEIFTVFGIPYGTPPIGSNRFEEAKPVKPWLGIWVSERHGPECIQHNALSKTLRIRGKENCLYLSIYTPSISSTSNLSVLVFFHGGAFMFGTGTSYKSNFILEHYNIVFITVNYRLGPFGFLSTEDDVVPGNNGLKDQVLALKWIQENIHNFGGDKTKVTISGNSAGGASVQYHYLSSLSRGMFDKGISSSGSALVPWALAEKPLEKAKMLANSLGCPTVNSREMVDCLKQRPCEQIVANIESLFMPWLYNPFSPFAPVVEINSSNPFLRSNPFDLLTRGDVYDRPWLASVTTEDGLYPVAFFIDKQEHLNKLNNEWAKISPHLLDFNYTVLGDDITHVTSSIKNIYLSPGRNISIDSQDKIVKMVTDRLFYVGMDLASRLQASITTSDVFFYIFAYTGEFSLFTSFSGIHKKFGVCHADDMLYLMIPKTMKTEQDKAMQLQLAEIWVNFINTGRPSSFNNDWLPVSKNSRTSGILNYLLIKSFNETKMVEDTDFGNRHFWDGLNLKENSALTQTLLESANEIETQ